MVMTVAAAVPVPMTIQRLKQLMGKHKTCTVKRLAKKLGKTSEELMLELQPLANDRLINLNRDSGQISLTDGGKKA